MPTNLKSLYKSRRDLLVFIEPTGREVVHVYLKGGAYAVCDLKDFRRLMRLGVSPNWSFNHAGNKRYGYVRAYVPATLGWGNVANVARLIIMPTGPSTAIRHADDNPLNLRAANLSPQKMQTKASGWESHLPARHRALQREEAAAKAAA